MRTKEVNVYNGENNPPRKEQIPIIDGYRERPSIGFRRTESGEVYEWYGDAAFALEQDIDQLIMDFTEALYPYIEFLREQGHDTPARSAINAALTRRNGMSVDPSRVEGANQMSRQVPRYRALANAAKAEDAHIQVHTYTELVVNVIYDEGCDSCVHLNDDGTYTPGWSDGYHVNEESDLRLDATQAMIRAIEIAKEQRAAAEQEQKEWEERRKKEEQ